MPVLRSMVLGPARAVLLLVSSASVVLVSTSGCLGQATSPASQRPGIAVATSGANPAGPGHSYPQVPSGSRAIAERLAWLEPAIRNPATAEADLPRMAHQQQVIYRQLSHQPKLSAEVRQALPARWQPVFDHHLAARREFLAMHRGPRASRLPAWRIIPPEPAERLLSYYRKAAAATGIDWQVLAAVNLVETGLGRIDGLSVANAQGPMQFLPTTWAESGIGSGSIRDPHDAIQAAARYLVRRGGLRDIRKGLWGYNNSPHYGKAVLHYAQLLKDDPQAFRGLYHWQIHVPTQVGDLWLAEGYNRKTPIAVSAYIQQVPASLPPR
jgi:hypothetical protein